MKYLFGFLLALACAHALAECADTLPLKGAVSISTCDPRQAGCVSGAEAAYAYASSIEDDPAVLSLFVHASPWHFYDADMRIMSVDDMAELVRSGLDKKIKRVHLLASWTGLAPGPGQKSLADKLSERLGGFPVEGEDGFLWLSKTGAARTTRQAFSVFKGGYPYGVDKGGEVMVSLAVGWPASLEETFAAQGNAQGVMQAGAGWEILHLCPDRALAAFESAAKLSHPIAAYNAAQLRLERGGAGDMEAALALLAQAAEAGDAKAKAQWAKLKARKR